MLVYTQKRWRLDNLFSGTGLSGLEAALSALEGQISGFELLRDELSSQIPTARFAEVLGQLERIEILSNRVYAFVALRFAENTQDQRAQADMSRVQQKMAELSNRTLFFELWWKNLEDDAAKRLLAASGDATYWFERIRATRKFTLSEPEERIINLKNTTGREALDTLYDSITSRYGFELELEGGQRSLTRGELMAYVRDTDPELRKAAYQALHRVYGREAPVLGQLYQSIVRDWHAEFVVLRGHTEPIATRNTANDLPDAVVDTLLEVSRRNAPVFQRYFRLKARWLKVDKLSRFDIYAPVGGVDKAYGLDEAKRVVLAAFQDFDPQFAELAERVFLEDHLDAEVRKGKRNGAFCYTVLPGLTPFVHQNFQGKPDDVSTMAHELGHAVHSMLAGHHSTFTHHATLPLAETASTFAEMILVDYLLVHEKDQAARREVLFKQIDGNYATIMRQAYFALFERQAHQMIQAGATTEELSQAYLDNLKEQFGDAVELPELFRDEWTTIPHLFGVPFYVYSYAFGQLLVLALYHRYKEEGQIFKPRLFRILSAGGSVAPTKLLAGEGVRIDDPTLWQGGYDLMNEMISRLESLPFQQATLLK